MRRFEFVGGSSAKFWQCKVEDSTFTIVFGRLGTDGQTKEKEFDDEDEANDEMARKITEKLKEGYVEVAAGGAAATTTGDAAAAPPAGAKGAAAASAKLQMPPRFVAATTFEPAMIKAATVSLKAFARSASSRSWRREVAAKEARRALQRLRGVELAAHKDLGDAFDAVADAVIGKPGLPLSLVMGLLDELPATALDRLLGRWTKASGPAAKAIAALKGVHEGLGGVPDHGGPPDELALRVGAALVDRRISDIAAVARFARVRSFVEAAAAPKGGLKKFLKGLDDGDEVVARRAALFAA